MSHQPYEPHTIDCEFLILDEDGLVVNVTVGMPPRMPDGWEAVCREDAPEPWIGWMRIDGEFINPNPSPDEEEA